MSAFVALLKRFQRDERGVFMVLFGILGIVLIAVAGSVVDFTSVEQTRTRAQNILDSAALGLQPRIYDNPAPTEEALRVEAQNLLREALGTSVTANVTAADIVLTEGSVTLDANVTVSLPFVSLVGVPTITIALKAKAAQGGHNLEIAVALDTTGSMAGSRLTSLIDATEDLIDLVIADSQTPVYSKMALVPYSMGVNVDTRADLIRGSIVGPSSVVTIGWAKGTAKTISTITKANPARVTTTANHGLETGDTVYFSGISDNGTDSFADYLNGNRYVVTKVSNTRYTLNGVNSSSWRDFGSSGGQATGCLTSACELVTTTTTSHSFANGEYAYFRNLATSWGTDLGDYLNGQVFAVSEVAATTFALDGTNGPSYPAYTSGGNAHCVKAGCDYFLFQNTYGSWRIHSISTCVSERTTNAYDDTAPGTSPLGRNYPASSNSCTVQAITPLTSNKTTLKAKANALTAGGSTGGHIGVAWTWYMLAPTFASLWPADSQPKAYTTSNLLKIAIIMTDGEYNSVYCNGVISQDSTSGSGDPSDHINCNAPNGSAYTQAQAQCTAMKAKGIIVYTVGFEIIDTQAARDLMANCASSPQHAYLAENGTELREAFQAIGNAIKNLRLAQ